MNHPEQWKNQKISKTQLNAFYRKVGETIADWLTSLECPDCKAESDLDWMLEPFSNSKPQFICRHCQKTFLIQGLNFKTVDQDELQMKDETNLKWVNPYKELMVKKQ